MYNRIKQLCQEQNLSIRKLEEKAGLSNGSIKNWKTCSPSVDKALAVADVLGTTVEYLARGDSK